MDKGVLFVVYGSEAKREAAAAVESLARHHPDWPVHAVGDGLPGIPRIPFDDDDSLGRWAKTNLDRLTPHEYTLYLDADTRVLGGLGAGFEILADGWDMAIAYSERQSGDLLWHVSAEEKAITVKELGLVPLQLQGGVFFFAGNEHVHALFEAWRDEWRRWRGQDQGALLRALWRSPVKLWLLGRPWNNGELVSHRYGAAKARR